MPAPHLPSPPPTHVAKVHKLAEQQDRPFKKTRKEITDRIIKCLARAQHYNTPEQEAITAWRLAGHLMAENNITEAELFLSPPDIEHNEIGGESIVSITSTKGEGARVTRQYWVTDVAAAVSTWFDCKWYSTARARSIEWTFYGIKANTVAAAMAFEMAHNLIQTWARDRKGANAKHSYCLGISVNLNKIAREEKRKKKKEEEEEQQQSIIKKEEGQQPDPHDWVSNDALVRFHLSAERVANEYLKAQNVKLCNGKRRAVTIRNQAEYQAGVNDSVNINLNQNLKRKRIEGA